MKALHKKVVLPLVLIAMVLGLTGCQSEEVSAVDALKEGKTASSKVVPAILSMQPEVKAEPAANINLLTGMPDLSQEAIGMRPVAVMVNNVEKSFPQYGIEEADIIFEIPVEGAKTRFMAIYADYTQVPKICSIRSCRPYFPIFSESFDAVYVNWGMDASVRPYVNSLGLTQYDGLYNAGNLFGRDEERKAAGYSLEHTGYFDGTRVDDVLVEQGKRITLEADKTGHAFRFASLIEKKTPDGNACANVSINFGLTVATFAYDEASGTYLKSHNGEKQIDGITGNQLAFTNVFVLETQITTAENGIHRDVNWHGGNGYYVSNGAMQKITWSKDSISSKMKFYDENGEELVINRGKSYIAVNYIGKATFE